MTSSDAGKSSLSPMSYSDVVKSPKKKVSSSDTVKSPNKQISSSDAVKSSKNPMSSSDVVKSIKSSLASSGAAKSSQNPLVSAMIKRGIIYDTSLGRSPSPTSLYSVPPPLPLLKASSILASSIPLGHDYPPPLPTTLVGSATNPTLFERMSEEHNRELKPSYEARKKRLDRINKVLADAPFGNSDNNFGQGDVKLTVAESDGFRISVEVHRKILCSRSNFFSEQLQGNDSNTMATLDILECYDIEAYLEAVVLMYSDDLKKKLMGVEVSKLLDLLQACSSILFNDGIAACLNYLALIPWSEDEEEKVVSRLNELQCLDPVAPIVLQRLVGELSTSSRTDDLFLTLLGGVLRAKDDKARREMKTLIFRLFRDKCSGERRKLDVSRDILYNLCHKCLSSLMLSLSEGRKYLEDAKRDNGDIIKEIAREADNLEWIVEILIERRDGDDFVKLWANQKDLAVLHSKFPSLYTHEISRITAQLCIAIGRGHLLVPTETLYSLLTTWLEALYDDFKWMKRGSRSLDKKLIEEGLGNTILTLPLPRQQEIMLKWYDRFLEVGDDCPDIHRAFAVWWRRTFHKKPCSFLDRPRMV